MKKKNVYLIFIIVFFLTSSMTPMHNFSIVADSEPSGDSVVWENNYGRLEVYPHTSNELVQHTQYANVTWKLSNNNIDLAFRFDNLLDVSKCNIWMWQNISHDVVIYDYGNISANYTLENISSFTPYQGTPSYVDLGDIPSDYYYNGTYSMNNITFNVTIGFDTYHWLNPEHTTCLFNYTYWGIVGNHIEQQYWFDWNSKKDTFFYQEYNGKHYYYVTNIPVIQNKSYQFKWTYNIPLVDGKSSGKWDLMGKLSSDTIQEALSSGHYVMLDPWWDSSWNYYRTITIDSSLISTTLINYPVLVPINATISAKCNGGKSIRFLNTDNSTEYYYDIENGTAGWDVSGTNYVWVNVTQVTAGSDTVFLMYYNNSVATDGQSITNVWSDGFTAVWHMNGSSAICDCTGNGWEGSVQSGTPDEVIGKIGKSQEFDDTNPDVYTVGDLQAPIDTGDFTLQFWMESDDTGAANYMGTMTLGAYDTGWGTWHSTHPTFTADVNGGAPWDLQYNDVDCSIVANVYAFYTITRNGNTFQWYKNGSTANIASTSNAINIPDSGNNMGIADTPATGDADMPEYDGEIDEIRISSVARNASWLLADFHSQNQTTGFLTWGSEVQKPSVITPTVTTNDATGVEKINATLQGTLTDNGTGDTTCWFLWGTAQGGPYSYNISQGIVAHGATFGYNTSDTASLSEGTVYYFDTKANNSAGWDTTGGEKVFLTKPNTPSNFNNINPEDGRINLTWDSTGGADKYYIRYNKDTGSSPTSRTEGTELCNISAVYYNTTYSSSGTYYFSIWTYAEDATEGLHQWSDSYDTTNRVLSSWFTAYETLTFGGKAAVSEGTINIDVAPDIWDADNPSCGDSTTENFTFYQNGTATLDIKIGFNTTNYTFVTYSTWEGNGHDQYCANFTTDTWVSETNVVPKVGGNPVTVLKSSLSGSSSFTFGLRVYMPKTVSTANLREDFKVMFNATKS